MSFITLTNAATVYLLAQISSNIHVLPVNTGRSCQVSGAVDITLLLLLLVISSFVMLRYGVLLGSLRLYWSFLFLHMSKVDKTRGNTATLSL